MSAVNGHSAIKWAHGICSGVMGRFLSLLIHIFGRDLHIAVCFHRFTPETFKYYSFTCVDPDKARTLLRRLSRAVALKAIHVTIDDGYLDALRFTEDNARDWKRGAWINFVCPRRSSLQVGYFWDLKNKRLIDAFPGTPPPPIRHADPQDELRDTAYLDLGGDNAFKLATLDELAAWAKSGFVFGNHGTFHRKYCELTDAQKREDISMALSAGDQLGPGFLTDFAFPYGTPGSDYAHSDIALVKSMGYKRVWTTERRPFTDSEMERCEFGLPRFGINGRKSVNRELLSMLYGILRFRLRALK